MNRKRILILLFCLCLTVVFCIPLFSSVSLYSGHDTDYHIARIYSLSKAIQYHDYFPSLFYLQSYGYGYASPLFYSNFLIYIPAVLNAIGVNITTSYKMFIFICVYLTSLLMFWCSYRIFKDCKSAAVSSVLYIFSNYFITDVFYRGALGEVLAFMIVPIIMLGAYNLIEGKGNDWFFLTIGFSCLLLVHNISFILICFAFGLYLMINIRKFLTIRVLLNLFKAVILSIGLTAFFLFPMLEQLNVGIYRVSSYFSDDSFAKSLLTFSEAISIFPGTGMIWGMEDNKINMSIGIIQIFIILISLLKYKENKRAFFFAVIILIVILMTTRYFPWEYLIKPNFIQFSCRLLIIAIPLCAILGGFLVKSNLRLSVLIIMLSVGFGLFQIYPLISLSKIDENNLKTLDLYYNGQGDRLSEEIWALGALDYMPITIYDQLQTREKSILVNDGQRILNYKQDYNLLTFEDERESLVEYVLPLIYYKGYKVVGIFDDKEQSLNVYPNEEGFVSFSNNTLSTNVHYEIKYSGTLVQSLSKIVSTISIFILIYMKCYESNIKNIKKGIKL